MEAVETCKEWGARLMASSKVASVIAAAGLLLATAAWATEPAPDTPPTKQAPATMKDDDQAASLDAPGDWPQWAGPYRNGVSTEKGLYREWPPGGPAILWRNKLGRGMGAPAVWDNEVYLEAANGWSNEEALSCVDAATGKELWKFYPPPCKGTFGGIGATPALMLFADEPCVVFGYSLGLGALRISDGKQVWFFKHQKSGGPTRFPPVPMDKLILNMAQEEHCHMLEVDRSAPPFATRELWEKEIYPFSSEVSSFVPYGGYLYGFGGGQFHSGKLDTSTANLYCLEPKTGTVVWEKPGFRWGMSLSLVDGLLFVRSYNNVRLVEATPQGYVERGRLENVHTEKGSLNDWVMPVVVRGRMYLKTSWELICVKVGDEDQVRCFTAEKGELLWVYSVGNQAEMDGGAGPRATPLIQDGRVYCVSAVGECCCLDLAKGALLWRRSFTQEFRARMPTWGHCSSPVIADGKLIVSPMGAVAGIAALDPKTGATLWQTRGDGQPHASFIVGTFGEVRQIIGYDGPEMAGWDLATGKKLWSVRPENGNDYNVGTPLNVDGKLLVATENNGARLYAFDAKTLKTLWAESNEEAVTGFTMLIGGNGRLLVLNEEGELALLAAKAGKCELLGKMKICGKTQSHPALADGNLFVRDAKTLYCYDLKPAERARSEQ